MTAEVAVGVDGALGLIGAQLGPTDWIEISQQRVNAFADATDDRQWIHVDVERAQRDSPHGGTIAHGYLTLALVPRILRDLLDVQGFAMGINYGADKIRFPSPVPTGARVRGELTVDDVTEIAGGIQLRLTVTITAEGAGKPACVAVVLIRRYL